MAKKKNPKSTVVDRSAAARKGWQTRKREARQAAKQARQRSAAARKGWETRRAAAAKKAAPPAGKKAPGRQLPSPAAMRDIAREWDEFNFDFDLDSWNDDPEGDY